MRLEDLRVFSILARAGSIHRAAQLSGMTQSAVTKILQRLELEFGIRLADRTGRGLQITPAGHTLLRNADGLRNHVADLYVEMQAAKSELAGEIRVGAVPPVLDSILLPLVAKGTQRNPLLVFKVYVQVTGLLIEAVIDGEIDLALVYAPDDLPEELNSDFLGEQPYCVVARKCHPLLDETDADACLAKAVWLLPQQPNGARELVTKYYSERKLTGPKIVVECNSSASTLISLIPQSDLFTVLTPQMLATHSPQELSVVSFPNLRLTNSLRLIYRRASSMSPETKRFRSAIISNTSDLRPNP